MYLLHCTWRCNILCSKHDIYMRMNEWNRHALFVSWNGRNRYLHSSLLKIWDFFHSWENSPSFHSFRYTPLVKRRNFSHSWKKSQIFNKDECKYLFLPFQLKNKACWFHSFILMSMSCLLHKILQRQVQCSKYTLNRIKSIRGNQLKFR